jgi:polysaccharide export outer membrane protein
MTKRQRTIGFTSGLAIAAFVSAATVATAQNITQRPGVPDGVASKLPKAPPSAPAPSYVIGPDDVLLITVWREPDVTGEVKVRPDGKITLSVGNDIAASGLTTDELKAKVTAELKRGFYEDPTVFIQVKEINSRRVYITGSVNKQGFYPLIGPMTVLQLISAAGGLLEYADKKNIMLVSATLKAKDGTPLAYKINYQDMSNGKNLGKYNIELRPGDQLIVR